HGVARREGVAPRQVIGEELRLRFGNGHDGAERLREADEVEVFDFEVKETKVERELVLRGFDEGRVEEREGDLVASREDDRVRAFAAAVREFDLASVKTNEIRLGSHESGAEHRQ